MATKRAEIEKWFRETLKFEQINGNNGRTNCVYCALELHSRIVVGKVVNDKAVPARDARLHLEIQQSGEDITRVSSQDPRLTQFFPKSSDALTLHIDMEKGLEYYIETESKERDYVRLPVLDCTAEGAAGLCKLLRGQNPDSQGVLFGLLSLSLEDNGDYVVDENKQIVGHMINYFISGDDIFFLDAQSKEIKDTIDLTRYKKQISYVQAKHRPEFAPSQESIAIKSESSSTSLTAISTAPQAVAKEVSFYDDIVEAARQQDENALQIALKEVSIDIRRLGTNYWTPAGQLAAEGNRAAVSFLRGHGAVLVYIARGAAMGGHIEYAEELRKEGAHINFIAQGAAMGGYIEYAEKLRAESANIHFIAPGAAKGGHIEYAEKLRAEGANINSIAQGAAMGGYIEYAEKLRAEGANIDGIASSAALGGYIEYAEKLRAEGVDINTIAIGAAQGAYDDYTQKLRAKGANIHMIAVGIAASGRIRVVENLRIEEKVDIKLIAQGAAKGGHIEYAEKLRAEGANIDLIAHGAALRGHSEYVEKLRAEGADIKWIAQGAARGGYVEYAEELRKKRKENIDMICSSNVIGVFETKEQLLEEYKKFVDALAQSAAQGGQEEYAEYLRINEGADIKQIAAGAAEGGHEKYVKKLYFLNEGVTLVDILDNALSGGHLLYAKRLWSEHKKFVNSTPCDAENKEILRNANAILTGNFVKIMLKQGKIKFLEELRREYRIDANFIVKHAALYGHERYIEYLCRKRIANVDSIKAAIKVPGISTDQRSYICDMYTRVSTSIKPNASINSSLQASSDPAANSSSTSNSNPNPVPHQREEIERNVPSVTSITGNRLAFLSDSTTGTATATAKRKAIEGRDDPNKRQKSKESEPNERESNGASTSASVNRNPVSFMRSSSSTIINRPIVPLPTLPLLPLPRSFSPGKKS